MIRHCQVRKRPDVSAQMTRPRTNVELSGDRDFVARTDRDVELASAARTEENLPATLAHDRPRAVMRRRERAESGLDATRLLRTHRHVDVSSLVTGRPANEKQRRLL